jgi:hypothetical protein
VNHLTKNKIIVYLATIFLVGGITGGVLGWTGAHQRIMAPPSSHDICDHVFHSLQSELELTPAQLKQLGPILERRARDMEAIHSRTIQQFEELIRASNEEIATTLGLNPAQRAKLEEMEKKRQEFMRKRFRPPGNPPGPRRERPGPPEGAL